MRITLGVGVTRAGLDETITGLWTFVNALGLLTDIIGERTGAAGVTVDGLLIRDAGIPEAAVTAHEAALAILESQITDGSILARLAAAEVITGGWRFNSSVEMRATLEMNDFASAANAMLRSDVAGDSVERFALHVGGIMQWGDGFSARDTNLFRVAAGELATDDDFNVGGALDLGGDIEVSRANLSLSNGANNNVATGVITMQRITGLSGSANITGLAGGRDGRIIMMANSTDQIVTLNHLDVGSLVANRFVLPGGVDVILSANDSALLAYDSVSNLWRAIGVAL